MLVNNNNSAIEYLMIFSGHEAGSRKPYYMIKWDWRIGF